MDLETENRLAALLMEEARLLRLQAEKEGVHVYLRDPKVRGRPNSRFLTATVLGVQQANRAAEVNEMWRAREKEKELDAKLKESARYKSRHGDKHHCESLRVSSHSRHEKAKRNSDLSCSSSKHVHHGSCSDEDSALRDDEVENFLHSRMKRGRGAIGSRMDEPGPFLALTSLDHDEKLLGDPNVRVKEDWEERVLGPEKPSFLKSKEWKEDGHDTIVGGADACTSRKHSLKEKRKEHKSEKKRRKERKSKHHSHRRRKD